MSEITVHTVAVLARAPTTTLGQAESLIASFVAAAVSGAVLKACEESHARTMAILDSTKLVSHA
jgi:hypothetical protein